MKTALFLSILLAASSASAAKPAAPKPLTKAQKAAQEAQAVRLKQLISRTLRTGEEYISGVATAYGMPSSPVVKAKRLEKTTSDRRVHAFTVTYIGDNTGMQVVKLDISCDEAGPEAATVWYFATSAGVLEKANALIGGKPRELDPKDPALQKLYLAELEYHLKPGVWLP